MVDGGALFDGGSGNAQLLVLSSLDCQIGSTCEMLGSNTRQVRVVEFKYMHKLIALILVRPEGKAFILDSDGIHRGRGRAKVD